MVADGYEDFMYFENMQWYSIEKWIYAAIKSNLHILVLSVSAAKDKTIQDLALRLN